ncbi:MAG TPA: hypothetical protein VF516_05530, partial [Kofleriaceae bacterium]
MGRAITGCRRAPVVIRRRWARPAAARQAARALHRIGGHKEASMTNARSWLRQLLIPILMVATLVGTVRIA